MRSKLPSMTTPLPSMKATRETFTILEAIADQRLLELEAALSHFVGLQAVRLLHVLAASLLAHLPLQRRDATGCASTAHEADRAVADESKASSAAVGSLRLGAHSNRRCFVAEGSFICLLPRLAFRKQEHRRKLHRVELLLLARQPR